jgi:hypothetical protein
MNVMIRRGLTALILTTGVVQMSGCANYTTPQRPVASLQHPQGTANVVPTDRSTFFVSLQPLGPGANDNTGITQMPSRNAAPIRGGNNYNWLAGGD